MTRPSPTLRQFADPACFDVFESDLAFFEHKLASFVPPDAFDAHAHWYDLRHILSAAEVEPPIDRPEVGHAAMLASMRRWMGSRLLTDGLYFPFPVRTLDCSAANRFLANELAARPGCRGLMMIRPQDEPAEVERTLLEHAFSGFKVYHCFADRDDTFHADQSEFLPEWAWELADTHGLWITMHMVLPRALSEPANLQYIREHCLQYPAAKMVLAHAARGFNAAHTVDAIDELRGIDNVFFDTSAVCEPAAFEAIIRATGTTRLMYGSDFPISEIRGKAISVGDGFMWLYQHNVDWDSWPHGEHNLVGIESLLALQQACRTMCLADRDIERIFSTNARDQLGIDKRGQSVDVQQQYRHAKTVIPGGTQLLSKRPEMFAPDHWPAYYEQAIGCEVIDTTGRRFIDMASNGILACVLGFADPDVNAAVIRRVQLGSMATQQTYDEVHLADLLLDIHPWSEMARFTRGGGEAMAVAVRIARAATGRDRIAICGYHGWHDWYLAANLGEEGSEALVGHLLPGLDPVGVPQSLRGTTLPFTYNRLDELDALIAAHGDELAAIIMEPTRHTDPAPGFLEGVRERADRIGAKLVFDEISIGWRLCLGGAHLAFGVTPDIAVFAKSISNGFAMGAVIGNATTMTAAQSSFISSAYWTEGIGPAAAVAAVSKMRRIDVPAHLADIGSRFLAGWLDLGSRHGVSVTTGGRPELPTIGFDHADGNALMTLFTRRMLDHNFLAGGGFSPTLAHQPRHVVAYLAAADRVFSEIAESIALGDIQQRIDGLEKHTMFARLT
ncbi:3-aminobutyryl-CoA aminotransferase [Maioricimonas rarisocia]|uniref:3-aminobutyryl-CoA aminotransferase n=1 Tax=Maioricimonas rarisocia TaxID=2528026 RepID=A0A517ZCD3_9PLAN|nr:aminotransferase class III-fold pyridoxal phosphate-dependent enzyme [Maioricimonas rarisocia]QDU40111.1 3-aminobutyryl-CoA aminotransferase [Maioricimonas rarisocia]